MWLLLIVWRWLLLLWLLLLLLLLLLGVSLALLSCHLCVSLLLFLMYPLEQRKGSLVAKVDDHRQLMHCSTHLLRDRPIDVLVHAATDVHGHALTRTWLGGEGGRGGLRVASRQSDYHTRQYLFELRRGAVAERVHGARSVTVYHRARSELGHTLHLLPYAQLRVRRGRSRGGNGSGGRG